MADQHTRRSTYVSGWNPIKPSDLRGLPKLTPSLLLHTEFLPIDQFS